MRDRAGVAVACQRDVLPRGLSSGLRSLGGLRLRSHEARKDVDMDRQCRVEGWLVIGSRLLPGLGFKAVRRGPAR